MDIIEFRPTDDGSLGLYNSKIDDIYHSKYGAYTEAFTKFILPSGILDFVKQNNEVNILDICYGIGYNSKVAITEIHKINPNCKINIVALENDINMLILSSLINYKKIPQYINYKIQNFLIDQLNIKKEIFNNKIYNSDKISSKLLKVLKKKLKLDIQNNLSVSKNQFLHNIYYHNISFSMKNRLKVSKLDYFSILYLLDDARTSLKDLNFMPDFIFHDGFTVTKQPELWTEDFFMLLKRFFKSNTILVTYSKSAPFRNALVKNNYYVGNIFINNKIDGTICSLNKNLIQNPLSDYELGLLNTNAGITYRDKSLNSSTNDILKNRQELQKELKLQSTTGYINEYKRLKNV